MRDDLLTVHEFIIGFMLELRLLWWPNVLTEKLDQKPKKK